MRTMAVKVAAVMIVVLLGGAAIILATDDSTRRTHQLGHIGTQHRMFGAHGSGPIIGVAPVNTVAPAVSGTAVEGQTLTTTNGTWEKAASYTYAWKDCNTSGEACAAIPLATATTYTLKGTDVGHKIRSVVTAVNSLGSTSESSAPTASVAEEKEPITCNSKLEPSMTGAEIASALGSAASGSTVCLKAGTYPNGVTVTNANKTSYVTVRPETLGGHVVLSSEWEMVNDAYFRFQELESTSLGWKVRGTGNHYAWIKDKLSGFRGLAIGNEKPIENSVVEGNTFSKIIPEGTDTAECKGIAKPTGGGEAIHLGWATGITITHNKFKEIAWHYIQGGSNIVVENNLFEGPIPTERGWNLCTHLNVWQIFGSSENDTFNRNILRGESGVPVAITPVLWEYSGTTCQTYKNMVMEDNLFLNAGSSDQIDLEEQKGLAFNHNTFVGGHYGVVINKACSGTGGGGHGENLKAEHNIAVGVESTADWQGVECGAAPCVWERNVSQDTSANILSTAHVQTGWSPKWKGTSWNPETEAKPPAGYYIPEGITVESGAGYEEGTVGP